MLQATVAALLSVGSFLKCGLFRPGGFFQGKANCYVCGVPGSLPLESKCDFYFNIICVYVHIHV